MPSRPETKHGKCTVDLFYNGGLQRWLTDSLCVPGIIACGWIRRPRHQHT